MGEFMKKVLSTIILSFSFLIILSCRTEVLPQDNNSSKKDIYLIKYHTKPYTIPASDTGYVSIQNNRSAISQDYSNLNLENNLNEKEIQGFHEIPSKIELNNYKFFQESIQNKNFRSVSGETDLITGEIEKEDYKLGDYRDFWIAVDDNPEDYKSEKINFECVAVGKNCYIWFSDSNNELTKKEFFNETGGINGEDCSFQVLADKFDSICDLMKKYFGSHEFTSKKFNNIINSKEKINIIVSDLYADASKQQTSGVYGYFFTGDMITPNLSQKSNETLAIYLDSYFYLLDTYSMYSTLVHEYCHMLTFINKTVTQGLEKIDTWYNEMLAMVAEDMFQAKLGIPDKSAPKQRLAGYFTNWMSLGFLDWSDESIILNHYANTYAFGAYLARNYGGVDLISRIARNNKINQEAIESETKLSFETLLKNFSLISLYPSNNATPYTQKDIYSLHKQTDENNPDGIYFSAIDLTKLKYYYNKDNETIEETALPIVFYAAKYIKDETPDNENIRLTKRYLTDLEGGGYSIHYIGKEGTQYTFIDDNIDKNMKYFIYMQ